MWDGKLLKTFPWMWKVGGCWGQRCHDLMFVFWGPSWMLCWTDQRRESADRDVNKETIVITWVRKDGGLNQGGKEGSSTMWFYIPHVLWRQYHQNWWWIESQVRDPKEPAMTANFRCKPLERWSHTATGIGKTRGNKLAGLNLNLLFWKAY